MYIVLHGHIKLKDYGGDEKNFCLFGIDFTVVYEH